MKSSKMVPLIAILYVSSFTIELKLQVQKSSEEPTISDKELDELLKDPKYQKLAESM